MEFPTPFHAGNPVYAPTSGVWKPCADRYFYMGFGAYPAGTSAHGVFGRLLVFRNKLLARCRKFSCGDTMARGYTIGISSQDTITYLYCNDFPFCNYWELEYYLKPLSGTQRLLRPVSNYLKGNHDIEFPVNTSRCVFSR